MDQNRTLIPTDKWTEVCSSSNGISVLTFNTLRRKYEYDEEYWVQEEHKDWNYRLGLLKNIFRTIDADIVCVQEAELDTMEEDFKFMKEEYGYDLLKGIAKENDVHLHTKPSIFFKSSKFKVEWVLQRTRTLLSMFTDLKNGISFFVIACHLQGQLSCEKDRCFQMRSCLKELEKHSKERKIRPEDLVCFFCGDFNAQPNQAVHQLLRNGKLTEKEELECFGNNSFKYGHKFQFEDAHNILSDNRPYTFKSGVETDAEFYLYDFIYFTPRTTELVALRDVMTEEQRQELKASTGIPNAWNPSDHLPVAALFKFKQAQQNENNAN